MTDKMEMQPENEKAEISDGQWHDQVESPQRLAQGLLQSAKQAWKTKNMAPLNTWAMQAWETGKPRQPDTPIPPVKRHHRLTKVHLNHATVYYLSPTSGRQANVVLQGMEYHFGSSLRVLESFTFPIEDDVRNDMKGYKTCVQHAMSLSRDHRWVCKSW